MSVIGRTLGEFADEHTGLFMWLVVLPVILGIAALILWATGINPDPNGIYS